MIEFNEVPFFSSYEVIDKEIKKENKKFSIYSILLIVCLLFSAYEGITKFGWISFLISLVLGLEMIISANNINTLQIQLSIFKLLNSNSKKLEQIFSDSKKI